jgi:septum site-determining protein MinC
MAAALIPATEGSSSPHRLLLPPPAGAGTALEEVRYGLANTALRGAVDLESGSWALHTGDLRELMALLKPHGLRLVGVVASCPTTLVAAAALGLVGSWNEPAGKGEEVGPDGPDEAGAALSPRLLIHEGTLRAGDHLQTEDSVLLLGDVNPGARISAGGHVLVWGRLRGVAHAGRRGDSSARIVALQLRPLQLRIADAVARGPQESPPEGLAEEARLEAGEIRIEPASAAWPLGS